MASMPYVDDLVREYLLFRGFTATWQSFSAEQASDCSCEFQARSQKNPQAAYTCSVAVHDAPS